MSEKNLKLEVVTPERKVLSEDIEALVVPSTGGYLGVLVNHSPLIASLDIGLVRYTQGGKKKYLSISGGFLEVSNNIATIIANTAECPEEIDVQRAKEAKKRAEKRLEDKRKDRTKNIDVFRAELALKRAQVRLRLKN